MSTTARSLHSTNWWGMARKASTWTFLITKTSRWRLLQAWTCSRPASTNESQIVTQKASATVSLPTLTMAVSDPVTKSHSLRTAKTWWSCKTLRLYRRSTPSDLTLTRTLRGSKLKLLFKAWLRVWAVDQSMVLIRTRLLNCSKVIKIISLCLWLCLQVMVWPRVSTAGRIL